MKGKVLSSVVQLLLVATVFLLPIIFLPFFTDGFDFGKQIFFLLALFLIFAVWLAQACQEKKLVYKKSHYLLPILLLLAAFLASTMINSSNRVLSLSAVTGTGSLLLMAVGFFLFAGLGKRKTVLSSLLAASALLSLLRLILFLGSFTFPIYFPSWNLVITKAWSPTGSLITQAILALLVLPPGFSLMYESLKQRKNLSAGLIFVANTLNMIGLGLAVHLLGTVAKPILLPQGTAWAIALEGLKAGRFAAFGLGPGQFVTAFTAFKPLSFNATDFWNIRFASSSNWYYQLLTEVGIVGLAAYLFLAWRIMKDAIKVFRQPRISSAGLSIYLDLTILLVVQLFIPLNFLLLAVMFILLAVARDEEPVAIDFSSAGNFAYLGLIFPAVFWGLTFFFTGRISLANYYFLNSLKAASRNDGVGTYNLQIKAIQADPTQATYRIAYSQTNLALANSLTGNPPPGGLTEQNRNTITQLIQQAIREAKAAVAIDPRNVATWENLAFIYRNLINFAQGADQWTISAYQQAIALDPFNPLLRVDLGGLYYGQKDLLKAVGLFDQAVSIKPDLANAHYNLANALREAGDLANSAREYEVTKTLVKIDSDDYRKVNQELEEVKKRLPSPTPAPKKAIEPETLSTPPTPPPGLTPPIELPNEGPNITPTP